MKLESSSLFPYFQQKKKPIFFFFKETKYLGNSLSLLSFSLSQYILLQTNKQTKNPKTFGLKNNESENLDLKIYLTASKQDGSPAASWEMCP